MSEKITIRETTQSDVDFVAQIYPRMFPEEDLQPLVNSLLLLENQTLSMVACSGNQIVAHIILTLCGSNKNDKSAALLGPLGVLPDYQRLGIGTSLIKHALKVMKNRSVKQVFVLGDPDYYHRFGFAPEYKIQPPYSLPEEWLSAWQAITLSQQIALEGTSLWLPEPWLKQELWLP